MRKTQRLRNSRRRVATPMENFRRARTLNQAALARLVGIGQQSISKIEKGLLVPSPDVEARIAAVLGVSRAALGLRRRKKVPPPERLAS